MTQEVLIVNEQVRGAKAAEKVAVADTVPVESAKPARPLANLASTPKCYGCKKVHKERHLCTCLFLSALELKAREKLKLQRMDS